MMVAERTRYPVPAVTRAAVLRAMRTGIQELRAEPPQRLADWAVDHFKLSADSSHQQGAWVPWPFQIGIMDAFSNDDIEQVDVQKAKRVGYTKMVVAKVGYNVAHRRRKTALWQPTDDDRDSFVRSEVEPMIADVKAVRDARRMGGRDAETIKYKQFRAAVVHFLGGKAARAYRRITVDDAILDEADGFDQVIEKSSDPVTLARGRLEGAPYPKLIIGSTPRIKNLSHVERQVLAADARMRYRIQCPHCGAEHPLIWGGKKVAHGFKWDNRDPKTVRHVCPHCHGRIVQADYLRVWKQGTWVCDITGIRYGVDRVWRNDRSEPIRPPRHVAFHEVWTAYSPQRTWVDIAREYIEAWVAHEKGDDGPLAGFTNETLAHTFEADFEQTEHDALQRRAKAEGLPLGVVPAWASVLLAFVDVQADRWECVTWAYGRDSESAAIDYRVIYGNTADKLQWGEKVAPLIDLTFPHARGGRLKISALGVDTGFQTHVAYEFCRAHKNRNVYATKGESQAGKPIKAGRKLMDINIGGRTLRKGVALWRIGTDTAKDLLHGRLQLDGFGPGRVHFAADLPDAFFKQLTAEVRLTVRTVRGVEQRWECPQGARNEVLDCTVGTMFLAEVLDLPRWTDRQWQRAESALHPDLFDIPEPPATDTPVIVPAAPVIASPVKPARPAPPRQAAVHVSDEWSSRL